MCHIIIIIFDIGDADMVDWKQTCIVKTNFICYVLFFFIFIYFILFSKLIKKNIGK